MRLKFVSISALPFGIALAVGALSSTALAEESRDWNDFTRMLNLSAQGVRYERIEDGRPVLKFEADSLRLIKDKNVFESGPFRLILPPGDSNEKLRGVLEAQHAIYEIDSRRLSADQSVKAVGEEGRLEAQTVEVDWSEEVARFGGPVRLTSRGSFMESQRLDLFWKSQRIVAHSVKMRLKADSLGSKAP